ncbi:hypothetical protein BH11ARM2_BH11ARM2_37080 [soil metagenome]
MLTKGSTLVPLRSRAVSLFTVSALLLNTAAPVFAQTPYIRPVTKPASPAPVSKGVPTLRVTPAVPPQAGSGPFPPARYELLPGRTLLDEEGYLHRRVTAQDLKAWRIELNEHPTKARRARLLVQIGETELASHEPRRARESFESVSGLLPASNPDRGLARFDAALCLFLEGRYGKAREAFEGAAAANVRGVNRRLATLYSRHAGACEGYHLAHVRLGIPEPPLLDPLCGVFSLAVCLRQLGMPHAQKDLVGKVRHDGEGSNMGDLLAALPRLGLAGRLVTATEEGLRKLPLPAVVNVEHDHFVAVTKATDKGVSYFCSDCGPWPGGQVDVTWKQWRALEAGRLLVVAKPGTAPAVALANLPERREDGPGHVLLASTGVASMATVIVAQRMLSSFGTAVLGQSNLVALPYAAICGARGTSPHCAPPMSVPITGGGPGSPFGTLDPVNLATGEEEYTAPSGLSVYNPTGPSVSWSHSYYSLANVTPNGFGAGWTHPYNVRIEDNSAMQAGGQAAKGGGDTDVVIPPSNVASVLVLPKPAASVAPSNPTDRDDERFFVRDG